MLATAGGIQPPISSTVRTIVNVALAGFEPATRSICSATALPFELKGYVPKPPLSERGFDVRRLGMKESIVKNRYAELRTYAGHNAPLL